MVSFASQVNGEWLALEFKVKNMTTGGFEGLSHQISEVYSIFSGNIRFRQLKYSS